MTLNFQNKLVFPAPENSYTVETSQHQVLYIPRDILKRAERRRNSGYPTNKLLMTMLQNQNLAEYKKKKYKARLIKK